MGCSRGMLARAEPVAGVTAVVELSAFAGVPVR